MSNFFRIENFVWAVLLTATSLTVLDLIPKVAKYQSQFADKTITITERMSYLDYILLRDKKGFVRYE